MGAAITVNPAVTHQTMVGWEATADPGLHECVGWDSYKSELLDRIVNEAGINRVRLGVRSGVENPTDWFVQRQSGQISNNEWRALRYDPVNDNSNASVLAPGRFFFTEMDGVIEQVVNPLRQRLTARGEALYVNLTYIDFNNTSFEHHTNPEEYAEFIATTFQHIKSSYGWAPDAVEIVLEPDNTDWDGADIGRAIVATGDRLKAAGYSPDFIAPSTTNMTTSLAFLNQMLTVPRVGDYLTDIAYHRYSGVSMSALQTIAQRATALGVRTAMLEHIGSGYEDLHDDLVVGRNSSWQQFTLAYCNTPDNGGKLYMIDPANPVVTIGSRTRFLRQYFLFIRAGAVRVGVSSGTPSLEPLAFRNTNGGYVVVVKANDAGEFHVKGLPAGTYGIKYATAGDWDVNAPDAIIGDGSFVNAAIPAAGVITIYRK